MRSRLWTYAAVAALAVWLGSAAQAQDAAGRPAAAPNPAKELLASKCYQCHTDAIWRDQRQGARAWEATLYRMMGRGAVWSSEEIKTMAALLATDFGPDVPRSKPAAR